MIAQLAQTPERHADPRVAQFRQEVAEKIAPVTTMLDAGRLCLSEKSLPSTFFRLRRGQNQWLDGSNRK